MRMSNLKIYTDNIEENALKQINELLEQEPFKDAKIRIMPDVHAGAGCVIGFTGKLGDKVIPNIVGVDIGCGMYVCELGKVDIDLEKLDGIIKSYVPSGREVFNESDYRAEYIIKSLNCKNKLKDIQRLKGSIGTLGGGNHFIEIDVDEEGNKYLVIHTGSRNLGKQVCDIYQEMAINSCHNATKKEINELIERLKSEGREKEIEKEILKLKGKYVDIPKQLCFLTGSLRDQYVSDMKLCQTYASVNRAEIANIITIKMGWEPIKTFETIHNYIGDDDIIRKGAVSAYEGQELIIPMNMRDGSLICVGKGNPEWNYSAPHGAGRIMSRNEARNKLSVDEFKNEMTGIYTTTANQSTIDEAPMAYKPMEEIIKHIGDTVEIKKIIKPIYNFKAAE